MTPLLQFVSHTLSTTESGASGWLHFVRSCERAMTGNQGLAPLLGLALLGLIVLFADWKFAGWLERFWRRRHPGRGTGAHSRAHTSTPPARTAGRGTH